EMRATLDGMSAQVGQDPRLDGPEFQPLRRELLQKALAFWEKAMRIDADAMGEPGWRTHFYRLQRALCLARLGKHQQASEEAGKLWATTKERSGEAEY